MSVQLLLPGFTPPPPRRPRPKAALRRPRRPYNLFFAIRPAPSDALGLETLGHNLAHQYGLHCQPLAAERLHVSLHNLGEYDTVPAGLVHKAGQVVDALDLPELTVGFDQAMVFRSPGTPYVLCGGEELDPLRNFRLELGMAMADAHMPVLRGFTPHMTLAYKGREGLAHGIAPARWPAHELVLINSHQGKTVHEVLRRWPLSA